MGSDSLDIIRFFYTRGGVMSIINLNFNTDNSKKVSLFDIMEAISKQFMRMVSIVLKIPF